MKITKVVADNRKHAFAVTTRKGTFDFPYKRCDPSPGPHDRLAHVHVHVDPELAREAFTYQLESGAEGSVHIDSVLDINSDPGHLARLELHQLTLEAKRRMSASGLSARTVATKLGTSPAQLYRLLDPTNYNKSARQFLALLAIGGATVTVSDTRRPA